VREAASYWRRRPNWPVGRLIQVPDAVDDVLKIGAAAGEDFFRSTKICPVAPFVIRPQKNSFHIVVSDHWDGGRIDSPTFVSSTRCWARASESDIMNSAIVQKRNAAFAIVNASCYGLIFTMVLIELEM
jgi:hypothetical protein